MIHILLFQLDDFALFALRLFRRHPPLLGGVGWNRWCIYQHDVIICRLRGGGGSGLLTYLDGTNFEKGEILTTFVQCTIVTSEVSR